MTDITRDPSRYLTIEQTKIFDKFLKSKKVSYAAISRILKPRTASIIGYYFKKNSWKIEDFRKVKAELEKRAKMLEKQAKQGFDMIDF